jgi:predicted glycoside hydrolase/deacetylase ChbG (UPF0249 family)
MTGTGRQRPEQRPEQWPVVLCADDYGLSPGVSEGIIRLIEAGRLTATSAMSVSPRWRTDAAALRPLADRADIGLHLTLTDQAPLGPLPRLAPDGRLPPVGTLLRLAFTGQLDAAELAPEIDRQLDAFEEHFGAPPDHVDGHQHVHLLPTVRSLLTRTLRRRYGTRMPYLRDCSDSAPRILRRGVAVPKALFISALSRSLPRTAATAGARVNASFRGIYDFAPDADLAALFQAFLWPAAAGTLIMAHPARPDSELAGLDSLVEPRYRELAFLSGEQFGDMLEAAGARPARFAA